jgi:hypothetical protein
LNGLLAAAQLVEDLAPIRLCEHLDRRGCAHGSIMPLQIYICQGMFSEAS